MTDASIGLTPAQVRTLQRLLTGPGTSAPVARRARLVLASVGHPAGAGAGGSRTTRDRWRRRYLEHAVPGLVDRPRSGRPSRDLDRASARSVLVSVLLAPEAGWTTRSLAEQCGRSQSSVARTWARTFPPSLAGPLTPLPSSGLRLVAAAVHATNSVLVLTAAGPPSPPDAEFFMRSPRRPPLQALLAADLLAPDRGPAPSHRQDGDLRLVRAARELAPPGEQLHVLTRRPLGLAPAGRPVHEIVVDDDMAWQGLLAGLVARCTRSSVDELVAVQHLVMAWAHSDRPRFEWTARAQRPPSPAPPAPPTTAPVRATTQALADDILAFLLNSLRTGRLHGGDHVTETLLSGAVHASRSHIRDALRSLAFSGLVDLQPNRGAVVPAPQTADVIETYAARRALGSVVVRRAAHWTPGSLNAVERALQDLHEIAATGDVWATGDADLHFQDTLAASIGMRRISQLMFGLTSQLRLFVAVLGLRYAYSIPAMQHDDQTLFDLITARDEDAAARAWQRKIDDATAYMARQVSVAARSRP